MRWVWGCTIRNKHCWKIKGCVQEPLLIHQKFDIPAEYQQSSLQSQYSSSRMKKEYMEYQESWYKTNDWVTVLLSKFCCLCERACSSCTWFCDNIVNSRKNWKEEKYATEIVEGGGQVKLNMQWQKFWQQQCWWKLQASGVLRRVDWWSGKLFRHGFTAH
jgi:hypothetical protein